MKTESFRTEIVCAPAKPLALTDRILTIGSCFSDLIGQWLQKHKFNVMTNPFGTVYNPVSIHRLLADCLSGYVNEQLFIEHDQLWHHFDYHSRWSQPDKSLLKNNIIATQREVNRFIQNLNVLIITYGTAWVYAYNNQQTIVSNCHKVPARQFTRRMVRQPEMEDSFAHLFDNLKKLRPDLRVILTVSPVRHLKDSLALNSVSKAALRLACHQLTEKYEAVEYFPSYEIMLDDLRDYRFYQRDKIHPNEEALDYIIGKFGDRYFTDQTRAFIETWDALRKSLAHRPYHPGSAAHRHFLNDLLRKLEEMKPIVNVDEEIHSIVSQLHTHA
jgi:hypothetical protein